MIGQLLFVFKLWNRFATRFDHKIVCVRFAYMFFLNAHRIASKSSVNQAQKTATATNEKTKIGVFSVVVKDRLIATFDWADHIH